MRTLVVQKIRNKKILNLCLLVGIAFLVAVFSCTPMFRMGSLDMLIQNKLKAQFTDTNEYPFVLSRQATLQTDRVSYEEVNDKADSYADMWDRYIGIDRVELQKHIWMTGSNTKHSYGKNTEWINIGCIPEYEEHTALLAGSFDMDKQEEGVYPCVMTEQLMDICSFVINDRIEFNSLTDRDGRPIVLEITGIVKENDEKSYFWHKGLDDFDKQVYVSENTMSALMDKVNYDEINYEVFELPDYREVTAVNIEDIEYYIGEFKTKDSYFDENITGLISDYYQDRQVVNTICWVLELPLIMLLLAFIYMIVNQILGMENAEIAMLSSRGFKRKEIVRLYLGQSAVLSLGGLVLGLPLGYLLCKIAASTDGFLDFTVKDVSSYHVRILMLPYAFAACVLAMLCITLPVAFYAKDTIVERKTKKNQKKKKGGIAGLILEISVLLISCYFLYNYRKQKDVLAMQVMAGEALDPMVFLNVTLFLFICGMLGLVLLHNLVKLIYAIGKKRWRPHTYVSLLQIVRGDGRSQFITVFLIFTISLGIVDANIAGTINVNHEERLKYDMGADMVIKERWIPKVYMDSVLRKAIKYYEEPDFQKYEDNLGDIAQQITRVVRDDSVIIDASGKSFDDCTMLAIHTKEFGETAELKDGINDEHWYNLLNKLAVNPSGVLISDNLAERLNLKVGDSIRYSRRSDLLGNGSDNIKNCTGIVCGVFKAWPGCNGYEYGYNDEGKFEEREKYGIIVNYAYEISVFGDTPYEIWIKLKEGADESDVAKRLEAQEIRLTACRSLRENIEALKSSPLIQITNGLFTLSFMISLVLCTIGFLIYWITSMKQRELLYGIYRAMGMSFGEVNNMLVLEQLLSSLMAGLLGGITGMLASVLHIDVLSLVYLPQKHNIMLRTVIDANNLLRFMIVLLVMVGVCLIVMRKQIRRLNIVQAIKLGED